MVLLGAGPLCALRAKRRPVPTSVKPGDQPEDTGLGPPQNLSWSQSVNACMSEKCNHRQPRSLRQCGSCFCSCLFAKYMQALWLALGAKSLDVVSIFELTISQWGPQ